MLKIKPMKAHLESTQLNMSERSMLLGSHNSASIFCGARLGSKLEAMEVFHQVLLQ